ncbi:anthocyanidin 3-O-glucosyltransferase 2-like [Ziziphus jujuba]|uniref:Glycosyltransferase n=1 Tax=Ziziphus jujuba TaxID=326968 RepID=A0ABM4A1N5_ZIZJJ|nr:anthocyanidin 3-O-glucosyltransferase 2-like [Ziziphus jujuba]
MKKVELIFIPSPGIGHLVSTVEMAKLLVARDHCLHVTVLVMKLPFETKVSTYLHSLSSSSSSSSFSNISARISFVILPHDHNNTLADSNPGLFLNQFAEIQKPHVREAVAAKLIHSRDKSSADHESDSPPRLAGFVIDIFCTTMKDVAEEFGIPTYVFFTSSASFLRLMFHITDLKDEENIDTTDFKDDPNTDLVVPGILNPVPASVLPGVVLLKDSAPLMLTHARRMRDSKGILVNTFAELESHAIRSLSETSEFPPVYSVGPILNPERTHHGSDIIKWLDDQPPSSVVFLCFGSMGGFSEEQVTEIAIALENSGVRFIWSLRQPPPKNAFTPPTDYDDPSQVVSKEFLDRTVGIGKIIGWAPQVDILSHPAIGGFVSHCGWNSILESLWFGVPMATWPLYAEQQFNAFEIVKEMKLGVEIKLDYRTAGFYSGANDEVVIVNAQEIETGIRKLMENESDVRKRVKQVSEKSKQALMDGGPSYSSLKSFIETVMVNLPSS